jgi:hypothetical protein
MLASPWFVRIWTVQVSEVLLFPNHPADVLVKTCLTSSTIVTSIIVVLFAETFKEFAFAKEYTFIWGELHIEWEHIRYVASAFGEFQSTFEQAIEFRALATSFVDKKLPYRKRLFLSPSGAVGSPAELDFILSSSGQSSPSIMP